MFIYSDKGNEDKEENELYTEMPRAYYFVFNVLNNNNKLKGNCEFDFISNKLVNLYIVHGICLGQFEIEFDVNEIFGAHKLYRFIVSR